MYFMEVQMRYIGRLLGDMLESHVEVIDVQTEVFDKYNQLVDETSQKTIWTHPGTNTFFRNDRGRLVFVSPFRNVEYWTRAEHSGIGDYRVVKPNDLGRVQSARIGMNGATDHARAHQPKGYREHAAGPQAGKTEMDQVGKFPGSGGKTGSGGRGGIGIGRATARALADQGVRLAVVDREEDRLYAAMSDELDAYGICADVLEEGRARRAVDEAYRELCALDILVNTVGRGMAIAGAEIRAGCPTSVLEMNYLHHVEFCSAFAQKAIQAGTLVSSPWCRHWPG